MRINIVTAGDLRKRYLFLSVPFEKAGHVVTVIRTSPFIKYLCKTPNNDTESKVGVVILIGVGLTFLPAYFMSKLRSVPVLLRLGGDPIKDNESEAAIDFKSSRYGSWLKRKLNIILAKRILKGVNGIIVVNTSLGNKIEERKNSTIPIFIIPQYCSGNKVEHDYFVNGKLELLTVTNLSFQAKAFGVIKLVSYLSNFVKSCSKQIIFRIAGSGTHLSVIENYLASNVIPDNLTVHLEGFVTDLDALYIRSDVFLYESEHDALPNVILESKKYGLPLLANNCQEFEEIVKNKVSGLLYNDSCEFQNYLASLIKNQTLRENLGLLAQKEFEEEYSVDAISKKLERMLLKYSSKTTG